MGSVLFILNDAPYGNERAYNGLRLAVVPFLVLALLASVGTELKTARLRGAL